MLLIKWIWYPLTIIVLLSSIASCDSFGKYCFESLQKSWDSLNIFAGNVLHGAKRIGKSIKFVEDFIDSTIEEDCHYTCKKNQYLVTNPKFISKPDGCGSFGFILDREELPIPQMEGCCDQHDSCYSRCGSDRDMCDLTFKKCLYAQCELKKTDSNIVSLKVCKGGAKLLYTTTIALGCASFKEAQRHACDCLPTKKTEL